MDVVKSLLAIHSLQEKVKSKSKLDPTGDWQQRGDNFRRLQRPLRAQRLQAPHRKRASPGERV